jgi:hypothetical protein
MTEKELSEIAQKINELHAKRVKATNSSVAYKIAAARLENKLKKMQSNAQEKPQG